jgi:hypothetical protein
LIFISRLKLSCGSDSRLQLAANGYMLPSLRKEEQGWRKGKVA